MSRYNKKRVLAYCADGVREFESIVEAARYYDRWPQDIYRLIRTGGETKEGVSFNYLKE